MAKFQAWNQQWAEAVLRVMKPGAYLMAFGGTRTYHRLICSIEDAGFEIRDCLNWLYGSGFPKGKGCLKPAWEPITLARKPGGKIKPLGIEECRIATAEIGKRREQDPARKKMPDWRMTGGSSGNGAAVPAGRWPPNLLLQHHPECNGECHRECVVRVLGEQSGESKSTGGQASLGAFRNGLVYGIGKDVVEKRNPGLGDSGTAARFYPQFRYAAKASRRERNAGLEGMEERVSNYRPNDNGSHGLQSRLHGATGRGNHHPTVKPLAVMEWLVKLACPEGGTVLDPFMGSGTTGVACKQLGRSFIGIEIDPAYNAMARKRIAAASSPKLATSNQPLATIPA